MLVLVSEPREHPELTGMGLKWAYDMQGLAEFQMSRAGQNHGLCLIEDKLQWCGL